jgi:hypothetical protein
MSCPYTIKINNSPGESLLIRKIPKLTIKKLDFGDFFL